MEDKLRKFWRIRNGKLMLPFYETYELDFKETFIFHEFKDIVSETSRENTIIKDLTLQRLKAITMNLGK